MLLGFLKHGNEKKRKNNNYMGEQKCSNGF